MRTETPIVTRLEDYRPSDFLIDRIELDIRLHPTATRIRSVLSVQPNPLGAAGAGAGVVAAMRTADRSR